MTEEERKLIAYHETGHALVGLRPAPTPTRSTRSRSSPGVGRWVTPWPSPPTTSTWSGGRELVDQLAMLLGGRTAEELIFADPTTGAANDIEKATAIARRMVMEYGMSDELGPMQYGKPNGEVFLGRDYSPSAGLLRRGGGHIDEEVRKLIVAAHDEARSR